MKKYVCTICGFIYDEADGYPDGDIPQETVWSAVPDSFLCPVCGASKDDFDEKEDEVSSTNATTVSSSTSVMPDEINYTAAELSSIFSNLSKGCEKQYDLEMADLYNQLSSYYNLKRDGEIESDIESLKALLLGDLSDSFSIANDRAKKNGDRGAMRALKWAEQVSRMTRSLLGRLESHSTDFIENTNVFVCDICGFIYVGDIKPEVCPVCKVPNIKMTQIKKVVA